MTTVLRNFVTTTRIATSTNFIQTGIPHRCFTNKRSEITHPLFSQRRLRNDIWIVEEKFFISWNRANIFFVKGSKADLLVDTGTGLFNLPRYLTWSGLRSSDEGKALYVVLTHSHFDHSGGAHQFAEISKKIMVHSAEEKILRRGSSTMTVAWITPQEVVPKPSRTWQSHNYEVKPVEKGLCAVEDGSTIDLGDKVFQVIHTPGHSPGSVALYDQHHGILVTGDTLYQTEAELIDWYPGSSVKQMWKDVEKIATLAEKRGIDIALPGHNNPLNKEEVLRAANRHIQGISKNHRAAAKLWPRFKTELIFTAHGVYPKLPESLRDWTFD